MTRKARNTTDYTALRAEVEAAVLAEVERVGADALNMSAVAKRFVGRGPSQATLYRWIGDIVKSGAAGQHLARQVKKAVAERAERSTDPAAELAGEVMAKLPAVISPNDIAGGESVINVLAELQTCIHVARTIIDQAKDPLTDKFRLMKTALTASEHLRRCLDTSARLSETMRNVQELDRFHRIIIEAIREASPEIAETILQRLGQVATDWGG